MDRPNVVVIMTDQMKATASHLWGSTFCETPSMARMAGEGVLFQNAFTPHPLCVPARCALWTGQWPHSNGSRRNETLMRPESLHAFEIWKSLGFQCGLIGKNHCFETEEDIALFDTYCDISHVWRGRGLPNRGMEWFRPLESIHEAHSVRRDMPRYSSRVSYATSDYPLEDYSTGLICGQAVRFLEKHKGDPFALWVSVPDPHSPYEAPKQYADMFPADQIPMPLSRDGEMDDAPERNKVIYQILGMEDDADEHVRGAVAIYHAMVRFLDDGVGQILDALERLNLRENTIVVFCADHGDFSGEHGMLRKGGVFYDCLTRIPMIVSWPGHVVEGVVDDSLVNLVDIAPTLLRLQGLDVPRSMHGQGLPSVTDAPPRDATFSEYGSGGPAFTLEHLNALPEPIGQSALMRSLQWREAEGRRKMVRTRGWKYVHDSMGDWDELYDMVNDPWELTNVVDDPANADMLAAMRLRLADWSIDTEDSPPVPLPDREKYEIL